MDYRDRTTGRRVGIAVTAIGLLLLLVFLVFGWDLFDEAAVLWGTFLAGILLTAAGITLLRLSDDAVT